MKTVFEKIVAGELPSEKVYEDDFLLVIKDKYPKAPIHFLIITKKVIPDLQSLKEEDLFLLPKIVQAAQWIAKKFDLEENGYRLVVNNGADAGQEIDHLHFHFLSGRSLGSMG